MQKHEAKIRGIWYLDSGCSRHMTGGASLFNSIIWEEKGYVKFGDDGRGKIIATGTIGMPNSLIENVYLVQGLKHNLLSISQLCDKW